MKQDTHTTYTTLKRAALIATLACSLSLGTLSAKVLATVDGTQITEETFDEIRAQNPGFDFDKLPKEQQKELINQAIERLLMAKDARAKKLDSTPDFTQEFSRITENIKDRLLVQAWIQQSVNEVVSKDGASEQDALNYYNSHKSEFNKPNARARHILVKTEAEAKKIIDELNKTPKNKVEAKFIELANKQTTDPASKQAQNGGDLGVFDKETMVKPFADAAFSMSEGSYSKVPVKTDFGYHIIYLISKADAYSFDDIKQGLINQLNQQKVSQTLKSKIDSLRAKAKIQITN